MSVAKQVLGKRKNVSKARVSKRMRTAVSRSMTRRRKTSNKTHTDDLHSGKDRSKHIIVMGRSKTKHTGAYGHFVYHQENSETISCQSGTQTVAAISGDLYLAQIDKNAGSGNFPDPYPNIYYRGLMEFNPNKRAAGDAGVTSNSVALLPSGLVLETTRLFVRKITYEIQVVNPTNTPTDFVLYITSHKKPVGGGNDGTGTWNQLTANPIYQAQEVLNNLPGNVTAAQATDVSGVQTAAQFGKTTLTTYGFSPFQLAGFRNLMKPLLKKEVNLAPGAYHKFEITIYVNKTFSEETLEAMRGKNMTDIPGCTFDIWGIVRGSPMIVRDQGTGVPFLVNKSVTTSSAEIGWTTSRKVEGHYFTGAVKTRLDYTANNFRTISGTTSGRILDIVDGIQDQQYVTNQ